MTKRNKLGPGDTVLFYSGSRWLLGTVRAEARHGSFFEGNLRVDDGDPDSDLIDSGYTTSAWVCRGNLRRVPAGGTIFVVTGCSGLQLVEQLGSALQLANAVTKDIQPAQVLEVVALADRLELRVRHEDGPWMLLDKIKTSRVFLQMAVDVAVG